MPFEDLSASAPLLKAIAARGYAEPTPVQTAVLAPGTIGHDLLVSSRTGSGKTIAFGLVIARELLAEGASTFPRGATPLGLVVAPTRELAQQVARELTWLFAETSARITTCVGGVDPASERRSLREGPHLVVGTPGRLVDHLERKNLRLDGVRVVVLDEADEMLDLGFREDLELLLGGAPAERRTLLFSATIPSAIEAVSKRYQRQAMRIMATPPRQAHQDIEVHAHLIAAREREHAVVNTLRHSSAQNAIVFCGTRDRVAHLHANLVERGFAAVALSGELSQPERTRALQALRDGRARVLVATDVAARGLDLPDVGLVIHADLPQNAEMWHHRSGRTGRAGRKGVSVLLVPAGAKRVGESILRAAGTRATWSEVPGAEAVRKQDRARLLTELTTLVGESTEDDLELGRALAGQHSADALAAALVRMRRAELPAPEDLPLSAAVNAGVRNPQHAPPRWSATRSPAHAPSATEPSTHPRTAYGSATRQRPAPEGGTASHAAPERGAPSPRSHRDFEDAIWYRVNVGRSGNADPRWLLPLICRRGAVSKEQIGKIQILADETRFQIVLAAVPHFERSVRKPDPKEPSIRIGLVNKK